MINVENNDDRIKTRSTSEPYNKKECVICQKPGGKLHKVMFISTGEKML